MKSGFTDQEKVFWNDEQIVKYFSNKEEDIRVLNRIMALNNHSQIRALDLGCGGGRHTEMLLRLGFNTFACDISLGMIKATKKRTAGLWPNDVQADKRVVMGDICLIPFPDQFFGLVIATGVLHQAKSLREYKIAIKELSRVVKPGGIICLNIFTNKIWDETYRSVKDEEYTVITEEGLYMTLVPKEMFYKFMRENSLILEEELSEDVKTENTGFRAVLRSNFVKV